MITTDKQPKEFILPLIVLVLSALNITDYLDFSNIISLLVSMLGLIGVVMFFYKRGNYNLIFKIWILTQFPVIYNESIFFLNNGIQVIKVSPIFMTSQFFKLSFGLTLGLKEGSVLNIHLNIIPFFYVGLYKILDAYSLIGKRIKVSKIKTDSNYINTFPIYGIIAKRIVIEKENDWLLAELESEIEIREYKTKRVLIHPKNNESYTKKKGIPSYLRIVNNDIEVPLTITKKEDYPTFEWVSIKIDNNKK